MRNLYHVRVFAIIMNKKFVFLGILIDVRIDYVRIVFLLILILLLYHISLTIYFEQFLIDERHKYSDIL